MATIELVPGIKPEEALKAFETIFAELERVRPLNYRSPLFTRWKQIVTGALARFLGAEHDHTKAFAGFVFHGPMPKSPMDPPVSQKDIEGFAGGMEATATLLTSIIDGLRPPPPSAEVPPLAATVDAGLSIGAPAASAPMPAAPAPADPGIKVVRGHGSDVGRQIGAPAAAAPVASAAGTPPAADPLRSSHDLSRHEGTIPAGGLKITARSGIGGNMATIAAFIEQASDPQEKELLTAISQSLDDPTVSWETMKHLLAELWWLRRETVQKVLPIILRR